MRGECEGLKCKGGVEVEDVKPWGLTMRKLNLSGWEGG